MKSWINPRIRSVDSAWLSHDCVSHLRKQRNAANTFAKPSYGQTPEPKTRWYTNLFWSMEQGAKRFAGVSFIMFLSWQWCLVTAAAEPQKKFGSEILWTLNLNFGPVLRSSGSNTGIAWRLGVVRLSPLPNVKLLYSCYRHGRECAVILFHCRHRWAPWLSESRSLSLQKNRSTQTYSSHSHPSKIAMLSCNASRQLSH